MFDDPFSASNVRLVLGVTLLILGVSRLGLFLLNLLQTYKWERQTKPELSDKLDDKVTTDSQEIIELKQECLNLREQLRSQSLDLTTEYQAATFQHLQSLLTQYKSVQQMVEAKPDLPAKNLTALFTPLDNLMQSWGYKPIGEVWSQVTYDPQIHQADSTDIRAGELVYVRFIGYRDNQDCILVPAKVSRTLPLK